MTEGVVTAVEAQLASVCALLDDLDLDALPDAELHALVVTTQRRLGQLEVAAGRPLARWNERRVWGDDRSLSAPARLSRELNVSRQTASTRLRRAAAAIDVPAVVDAVRDGVLSPDHVGLLASACRSDRERYAADEEMLIEHCASFPFKDAQFLVSYWKQQDGSPEPATSVASASQTFDGTVVVDATLHGLDGEIFSNELTRLTDALRLADNASGTLRTAAERRAAAMVEMATRSRALPENSRRPRPLFTVVVGEGAFASLCETSMGHVTSPAELARHADAALLEVVLFDNDQRVLSVSKQRTFTGALRRAIQVRDRHCQHPAGCDVPADRCDVDHIVPWAVSQRTDQFNGRLECPGHNRWSHLHDHAQPLGPPPEPITPDDLQAARQRWARRHRERKSCDSVEPPAPPLADTG